MDKSDKQLLLAERLDEFRKWTYQALVAEIARTQKAHDCLRIVEGIFDDGTEYVIEFNVLWDGRKDGDVRVCGDITALPQHRPMGVLPIFTPDATDCFLMTPDGTFVGE